MSPSDYEAIVKSARIGVPIAGQIEEIFGDADHFISRLGMGDEIWNTEVFFGGRYSLTMQVAVTVDMYKKIVDQVGEPKFFVMEYTKITFSSKGSIGASHKGLVEGGQLNLEQWNKLYENKGDFSVIGVKVNEAPLADFDEYVKNIRKDRIPISLLK